MTEMEGFILALEDPASKRRGGLSRAVGRCTLDLATGLGLCTFSDGTGQLAGFQARVDVTCPGDGIVCDLDGTYSFAPSADRLTKHRLQQLFFPEGIAFDGNRFNRTVATPLEPRDRLVAATRGDSSRYSFADTASSSGSCANARPSCAGTSVIAGNRTPIAAIRWMPWRTSDGLTSASRRISHGRS